MPFVNAGKYKIHYQIAGVGEPLVLLHGMSNNSNSWHHQLRDLSGEFKVIAWDAPGYGLSFDPDPLLTQFHEFADVLYLFLKALALSNVHLLGHSMGAAIAVDFCCRYPDSVKKLILADATRAAAALSPEENERRFQERISNIEMLSPTELAERRADQLLAPNAPEDVRESVKKIMAQVRPPGYKSVAYALRNANQMSLYPQIKIPVLLICGELDCITPVSESRIIHERIPGSQLRTIPNTGHLCYQEDPDSFNLLVREFLRS